MKQVSTLKIVSLGLGFAALTLTAACGGGVEGTYGDPNGAIKIELKSGGKASFSMMNQTQDCTYTTDKKKVSLDCKDGTPMAMTVSDDGTQLMMPPGSLIPSLKKQ